MNMEGGGIENTLLRGPTKGLANSVDHVGVDVPTAHEELESDTVGTDLTLIHSRSDDGSSTVGVENIPMIEERSGVLDKPRLDSEVDRVGLGTGEAFATTHRVNVIQRIDFLRVGEIDRLVPLRGEE